MHEEVRQHVASQIQVLKGPAIPQLHLLFHGKISKGLRDASPTVSILVDANLYGSASFSSWPHNQPYRRATMQQFIQSVNSRQPSWSGHWSEQPSSLCVQKKESFSVLLWVLNSAVVVALSITFFLEPNGGQTQLLPGEPSGQGKKTDKCGENVVGAHIQKPTAHKGRTKHMAKI